MADKMGNKKLAKLIVAQFNWWDLDGTVEETQKDLYESLRTEDKNDLYGVLDYFDTEENKDNTDIQIIIEQLKKRLHIKKKRIGIKTKSTYVKKKKVGLKKMVNKELINKIKELRQEEKDTMNEISKDFSCDYNVDTSGSVGDCFCEHADSQCSIYTSDLYKWLQEDTENIVAIEDSVAELGFDCKKFNFTKLIQQGQWYKNERDLRKNEEQIIKVLAYNYLINELENNNKKIDRDTDDLIWELESLDSCCLFDTIKDLCDKFLKGEKE